MYKKLFVTALACASIGSAQAVVIVNGVAGEDVDGLPPFRTIQAALDYANDNGDPVVDIITTRPNFLGASLRNKELKLPITIQNSSATTITTALDLLPTTGTHLITLKNLYVSTTGLVTPLIAGTSIQADNCIFTNNPAPDAYGPAVTAAVGTTYTTATLNMTSCTLIGHWGLEAGRAIRDYNLTRCVVIGQPTKLDPGFSPAIMNSMNWYSSYTSRMGVAQGYVEIQEPRTLTLDQCIVRGGTPLGWPAYTLGDFYTQLENNTLGPITATNTVFDYLNINARAEAIRIGQAALPPTQNLSSTFKHCTFRSADPFGFFYLYATQPTTHTFINCLYDSMAANYGIGVDPSATSNLTLTGDANTYHVPVGTELFPFGGVPPFEVTKHFYIGNSAQEFNITDNMGSLVRIHEDIVAEAVLTVPPTLIDKDGNPRPLPAIALASDIGADEIDETGTSKVRDWSVY